jgi:glucose-fructose oxidoreductase
MRKRAWRIDKKLGGGGPMMDLGIYVIQASCMATGQTPISVSAREEPKTNPELFNEVEESIRWQMDFPNGAVCNALTSFSHNADQYRAEAPKGWYELTKGAFGYSNIVGATSRGPLQYPPMNQQAAQMDDFAECVATGRATPVPGEMGQRDMRIITAIYQSVKTGKTEKV